MRTLRFDRFIASLLVTVSLSVTAYCQTEKPAPLPVLKEGVKLFSDRAYELTEAPDILIGLPFLRTSIEGYELECVEPGDLYVMTITKKGSVNQSQALEKAGFKKVETPVFQLFPGDANRVTTWKRNLNPGDNVAFQKLAFPVLGDGLEVKLKMLISRPLAKLTKPESEFTALFDGETFDGWEQKGNWVIEDGAFYRKERGGSLTYTAAKVPDDFELRFDWKVSEGCNSGVYYRPGQVEYQVLDNIGSPYGENARQAAASLFFCMAPSKDATHPVGKWNTARIICKGSVIEHWLNGERVLSFDYDDPKWSWYVDLLDARSGDLTGRNGQLWLQDHGQDVWFRKLRWRKIPADEVITPEPYFEPMPVTGEALKKEEARVMNMLKAKANKPK